jgi:choline dehydrogenase-like flavoprotein
MTDHYDVIIIGTGAGGGTLARHLAPSGKRVLLLERGDWLPREPHNWSAQDVFVDGCYISPDTWHDAKGKAFQPQIHYFVGGATKLYGAALYRLRREDFGELHYTTASRRPGRSPTTTWSRTTRWPSSSTRSTAPGGRTRPSHRRARPTRTPRSRTSPGSSSSPTTSPPRATTRSTRRAA